jgi:hypothetical protein
METIKHVGRDGAILAAFAAGALVVTLVAQLVAGVIIDIGEMVM